MVSTHAFHNAVMAIAVMGLLIMTMLLRLGRCMRQTLRTRRRTAMLFPTSVLLAHNAINVRKTRLMVRAISHVFTRITLHERRRRRMRQSDAHQGHEKVAPAIHASVLASLWNYATRQIVGPATLVPCIRTRLGARSLSLGTRWGYLCPHSWVLCRGLYCCVGTLAYYRAASPPFAGHDAAPVTTWLSIVSKSLFRGAQRGPHQQTRDRNDHEFQRYYAHTDRFGRRLD